LNHSDTDIPQTIDYFADPIEQDEDMAWTRLSAYSNKISQKTTTKSNPEW
jgi:hypothetical protein